MALPDVRTWNLCDEAGLMTGRSVLTPYAPPLPCGLPYHRPGQRVTWLEGFTRRFGNVVLHETRTLIIRPDDGSSDVYTSCGHVVGVK